MSALPNFDDLPLSELKHLVLQLLAENAEQKRQIAELREEIARLKGLKGCPDIKPPSRPSGMEKGTSPKKPWGGKGRGKITPRVRVEERVIGVNAPVGSRFKGYESFLVQDLVLRARAIRYRRERWVTPEGQTILAPLPAGVVGHFGAELRRFALMLHHQGQVTVERLTAQLRAFGVAVSKRQVMRLLIEGQDGFLEENREVLWAGLATAAWVTVDDTGARHAGRNRFCTHIGNDDFAWFGTRESKSRLNFLDLLRAGQAHIRNLIWWYYSDLKAYRADPTRRRRSELRTRFDRIFRRRTGFVTLDRLLARLHANKAEMLAVLDRPEIPLHTNGSERDIRLHVTKRKISGGTQAIAGRDRRDAFPGLMRTATKLGFSFWDYLGNRLHVPDQVVVPYLPDLLRARAHQA